MTYTYQYRYHYYGPRVGRWTNATDSDGTPLLCDSRRDAHKEADNHGQLHGLTYLPHNAYQVETRVVVYRGRKWMEAV